MRSACSRCAGESWNTRCRAACGGTNGTTPELGDMRRATSRRAWSVSDSLVWSDGLPECDDRSPSSHSTGGAYNGTAVSELGGSAPGFGGASGLYELVVRRCQGAGSWCERGETTDAWRSSRFDAKYSKRSMSLCPCG